MVESDGSDFTTDYPGIHAIGNIAVISSYYMASIDTSMVVVKKYDLTKLAIHLALAT